MYYQMLNFCHNIKHLRTARGYSYTKTAAALHTTVKILKLIENGILPKHVSIHIVQYASTFFDTPIVYLFMTPKKEPQELGYML